MGIATEKKAEVKKAEQSYVILELAFYQRYTRGVSGTPFEAEKAYRFTADQAAILLEEVEATSGRPIWRRYKSKVAPQKIQTPEGHKQTFDASVSDIKALDTPDEAAVVKQISVGDDSEIADILAAAKGEEVQM